MTKSGEREDRANEIMSGALDGVSIEGRVLAVSVGDPVVEALTRTGLEVSTWDRWVQPGREPAALPPEGPFDRVCMRLPKGRDTLRAMLDLAVAQLGPDGRLWLYGGNDEGIRSASKTLKDYFLHDESIDARRHCRVLSAEGVTGERLGLDAYREEVQAEVAGRTFRFSTLPGVFAYGRLDEGTRVLLEGLQVDDGASVLDFGCGAGVVSAFLGERSGSLVGVDVDAWAVHCASEQRGDHRVGDGFSAAAGPFDHIVSNPPFHAGKDTDFRVMEGLLTHAKAHLNRGGRLTFVCPATAPVYETLKGAFTRVDLLSDDRRYRVWEGR